MPTGYTKGLESYGFPLVGSGPYITTGKVWFVHGPQGTGIGVDANGRGTEPKRPFATIDYAIGKAVANKGDIIFMMPGHVETVSAAAGLVPDKAGLSIIGLGVGDNVPQINFTATASTMTATASNLHFENLRFTGGIDAVVSPLVISGDQVSFRNIVMEDVTGQVTDFAVITGDDVSIEGLLYKGASAAGTNAAIALNAAHRFRLRNFSIDGNFAVGAVDFRTTLSTDADISHGYIRTRNDADIAVVDTITGSTGKMGPFLQMFLNQNAANINEAITGATFVYFDPLDVVNLAGESAVNLGKADSTDA